MSPMNSTTNGSVDFCGRCDQYTLHVDGSCVNHLGGVCEKHHLGKDKLCKVLIVGDGGYQEERLAMMCPQCVASGVFPEFVQD